MVQINWTNCAEQMPPDTMQFELIYRVGGDIKSGFGMALNAIAEIHPRWITVRHMFDWTPYTPEKWKELNK